jgi:CRISPR-associated endonuclease/helicase Cas3
MNVGRTSGGTELTDELLDRLVDEAEAGYRPEQLRARRGPGRPRRSERAGPSKTLNVRVEDDLRDPRTR